MIKELEVTSPVSGLKKLKLWANRSNFDAVATCRFRWHEIRRRKTKAGENSLNQC